MFLCINYFVSILKIYYYYDNQWFFFKNHTYFASKRYIECTLF